MLTLRSCFIPMCPNTSANSKKLFISVPRDPKIRRKWMATINKTQLPITMLYCCEDHFNLKDDAKNWMYFKTIGTHLTVKNDIVPHKNIHQEEVVDPFKSQLTPAEKRKKKINIKNLRLHDIIFRRDPQKAEHIERLLNSKDNYIEIEDLPSSESIHNIKFVNIDKIKTDIEESKQVVLPLSDIKIKNERSSKEVVLTNEVKNSSEHSAAIEQSENSYGSYLYFDSNEVKHDICGDYNIFLEHNYCKNKQQFL